MSRRLAVRGLTLVELVVAIAVIAILLALLLPAIQFARAAALRSSDRNNQKQLALAIHGYADANKYLPPLFFRNRANNDVDPKYGPDPAIAEGQYSWIVKILPYLEEDALYKQLSNSSNQFTEPADKIKIPGPNGDQAPGGIAIAALLNPAEPPPQDAMVGRTNYVVIPATRQQSLGGGKDVVLAPPDGVIIFTKRLGQGINFAGIPDGTSRTFMLTESREENRANWYDFQQTFVCGFLPGDTSIMDGMGKPNVPRLEISPESMYVWVFNEKAGDRTAMNFGPTLKDPKQAYNTDEKDPLRRTWGPSSSHAGGIIVHTFADASVTDLVVEKISPKIYYGLITRRGEPHHGLDPQ